MLLALNFHLTIIRKKVGRPSVHICLSKHTDQLQQLSKTSFNHISTHFVTRPYCTAKMAIYNEPARLEVYAQDDIQRPCASFCQKISLHFIHICVGFIFSAFYFVSSLVHFISNEAGQYYGRVESIFFTTSGLLCIVSSLTYTIQRNAIAKSAMQFEALVASSNKQKKNHSIEFDSV